MLEPVIQAAFHLFRQEGREPQRESASLEATAARALEGFTPTSSFILILRTMCVLTLAKYSAAFEATYRRIGNLSTIA